MRTIRLNLLLILLIMLSGVASLALSAAIALHKSDRESRNQADAVAKTVQQQLEWQLLKVEYNVMSRDQFPDFYLWKDSQSFYGLCVSYETVTGITIRSLCTDDLSEEVWPHWFEALYLNLFSPDKETVTSVSLKGVRDGSVKVSPNPLVILHKAWQNILSLMEFSIIVITTLCLLMLLGLHWLLKPVRLTQKVIHQMHQGDLSARVPEFRIQEWQTTGHAINTLATNLEATLDERKQLSLKLLNLQESERRYICRELHDEFGQSLTGLRAIAFFLEEEARERCPQLSPPLQQISSISEQMMRLVKNLLFRLRPADLDELGLSENLKSMITEWNSKHKDKRCFIEIAGEVDAIKPSVAVNLLRTVQESLTNIVKHASATRAEVQLQYLPASAEMVHLTIQDNGNLTVPEPLITPGNGLLGIRERVQALNGELNLSRSSLGGLKIEAIIPITEDQVANE